MAFTYDHIIIGAGASGSHLALAMLSDPYFEDKDVLIIERSEKKENDKTWSFWEDGSGKWDDIIYKQWRYANVFGHQKEIKIDLETLRYKMLRSVDFYAHARHQLKKAKPFTYVTEKVVQVKEVQNLVEVITDDHQYKAKHVFDSRLPDINKIKQGNATTILQHFRGFFLKTDKATFDPERFTMMDYRLKDEDCTSFTYVLPIDEHRALVEFTYFTPKTVDQDRYDDHIDQYLKEYLGDPNYKVEEIEQGIIPMSTYDFSQHHSQRITKIGTAGGWVKASSGYSFKFCERKSARIVDNIKQDRPMTQGLKKPKYKRYDKIFIDVLYHQNHYGETIFYKLYSKNKTRLLLDFLDERTSFMQDLKIINSLRSFYFIKAFFKTLFG
jgi:lycopene beta-cyclase